jgi:3',5'-cyclic AMP phosphodiesterase CpdA
MRTIAHISDLHFGAERADAAEALRMDLENVAPSLVVISGDFTQRARRRQFIHAAEYVRTLPGPQLVVPGNHDVPLYDVFRRFLAPLTRYRRFISEELNPVYDDGELFVAGLNTARSLTWKSGRISLEQIEQLQVRLLRTTARFKVVVTHHPFIPPPVVGADEAKIDLVGRAACALNALDAGGVDLLLSGHLHHSYAGDTRTQYPAAHRAIIAAQAGTAISHRVRRNDPNGYNLITLTGDCITIEVRARTDGGAFRPLATTRYARHAAGWLEEVIVRPAPPGGLPGP